MKRSVLLSTTLGLALFAAVVSSFLGCEEKELPVIVDADEIYRYLDEVDIARELFRVDGLVTPASYTVPSDSATYYDTLVGHRRSREILLAPLKVVNARGDSVTNERAFVNYGIYGSRVREGVVWIHDIFNIQVTRVYADTTLIDTLEQPLSRGAFFLKLGDDSRDYVGWVLWGFAGLYTGPGLGVELKTSSGREFRGDWAYYPNSAKTSGLSSIRYVRLIDMDTVRPGERVLIRTYKTSDGRPPTAQLITDYSAEGLFSKVAHRYDTLEFTDSLSYQTPTPNPRLYNLIHVQKISEGDSLGRSSFVVPYRW